MEIFSVVSLSSSLKNCLLLGVVESRRLKEEDCGFEVSLGYLVKPCWGWAAWNVSSDFLRDLVAVNCACL